jgi:beta-lactamase regulating signal transducer with metallopeptidase domain
MRCVVLLAVVVVLAGPVRVFLLRARWTVLAPRAAIALWQAVALASVGALVGMCILLTSVTPASVPHRRHVTDFTVGAIATRPPQSAPPGRSYALTVGIIVATLIVGALVVRGAGMVRARARHRALLDLVAVESTDAPGTVVLEHPGAAAYSLAGFRPRVVVSRGAMDVLSKDELAAVLAHERAHLRARHDLVLFPFRCLSSVLPRWRVLAAVTDDVHALVEMAADDRAIRQCGPDVLAQAMCRIALAGVAEASPAPPGPVPSGPGMPSPGSPASGAALAARVERALTLPGNARVAAIGTGLSTVGVLALPLVALLVPAAGR